MITYGSVCSGIEAASVAWEPLGFRPSWFSQFDPEHNYKRGPDFPSAVLAHHWPHVANLGDMTLIADAVSAGFIEAPDVLVGGTPCQAFSVAGLRGGLSDGRGFLTLKFVELADAIDKQRPGNESIIVWENVPGVLSSKDNAFGCFLAGLAGESEPLVAPGGVSGRTLVVCLDHRAQSLGGSSTPNISEWPNAAAVCSLSQVLERGSIPPRYFLSSTACAGILRRAENRGKKLPELLEQALKSVASE